MMNGFFLFIGKQGGGKTLYMTKVLIDNYDNKRPIYSNYTLFNLDNVEYIDDTLLIQLINDDDVDKLNNSIILLDEIHVYLDSLDFMKKHNRTLQGFFSQLRKRNILLLATTQYLLNLDVRIRRQIKNIFEMKHLKASVFNVKVHEIDGYYSNYLHELNVELSDYYKYYDTNEVIF